MVYRFTLATLTAALSLTGCATLLPTGEQPVSQKAEKPTATAGQQPAVRPFSSGPAQVNVTHAVSRTDDGSTINITVDGNDAGALPRGQTTELHLMPGKHKVGGYVSTLYGYGRVTVSPVEIVATQNTIQHVTYSTRKNKPTFSAGTPTPAPVKPLPVVKETLVVPMPVISQVPAATSSTPVTAPPAASTSPPVAAPAAAPTSSPGTAPVTSTTSAAASDPAAGTANTETAHTGSATGTASSTDAAAVSPATSAETDAATLSPSENGVKSAN